VGDRCDMDAAEEGGTVNCAICGKDRQTRQCAVCEVICAQCCFALSAGYPEALKKIKLMKLLMKEDVLEICARCLGGRGAASP